NAGVKWPAELRALEHSRGVPFRARGHLLEPFLDLVQARHQPAHVAERSRRIVSQALGEAAGLGRHFAQALLQLGAIRRTNALPHLGQTGPEFIDSLAGFDRNRPRRRGSWWFGMILAQQLHELAGVPLQLVAAVSVRRLVFLSVRLFGMLTLRFDWGF